MKANRFAKIIQTKNTDKLRELLNHLSKGDAQLMTESELSTVFDYLEKSSANGGFELMLWLVSSYSSLHQPLLDLALKKLDGAEMLPDNDDTHGDLRGALLYAIRVSSHSEQKDLIDRFKSATSLDLSMVVAEYVANTGNPTEGLMVMVDLLPRVGSNHDVSDAIAMWLGYCGNGVLRKEIIDQAAFEKKNEKAEHCRILEWAASMIPDENTERP